MKVKLGQKELLSRTKTPVPGENAIRATDRFRRHGMHGLLVGNACGSKAGQVSFALPGFPLAPRASPAGAPDPSLRTPDLDIWR